MGRVECASARWKMDWVRVRSAGSRCQGQRSRGEKLRPRRAVCAHLLLQSSLRRQVRVAFDAGRRVSSWPRFQHFQPLLLSSKTSPC